MAKDNPFKGLRAAVDELPEEVMASLGHGILLRIKEVTKVRKSLVTAGFDLSEADAELDLLKGTKATLGLADIFEVAEEKKKGEADPAGEQRDIEDERDYRTHDKTTDQVRELVSSIVGDNPPANAVRQLNALEDGERDREGGPRESVLKVIRSARTPVAKKVKKLTVEDGGANVH